MVISMSLRKQKDFLQFVPVIGSRELEGKAAKGGIGFGGEIYLLERVLWVGAAMVTCELR
jgi:hypothetical protein